MKIQRNFAIPSEEEMEELFEPESEEDADSRRFTQSEYGLKELAQLGETLQEKHGINLRSVRVSIGAYDQVPLEEIEASKVQGSPIKAAFLEGSNGKGPVQICIYRGTNYFPLTFLSGDIDDATERVGCSTLRGLIAGEGFQQGDFVSLERTISQVAVKRGLSISDRGYCSRKAYCPAE